MPGKAVTDALLQALPTAPALVLPDLVKVLVARDAKNPRVGDRSERVQGDQRRSHLTAIRALRFAASASDHAGHVRALDDRRRTGDA